MLTVDFHRRCSASVHFFFRQMRGGGGEDLWRCWRRFAVLEATVLGHFEIVAEAALVTPRRCIGERSHNRTPGRFA